MITDPSSPVDPRAQMWGKIIRAIALLGVGLVVAPYIFTAITGLAGLAVAGLMLTAGWMLTPWLQAKAINTRLKLIKHEAAVNPVETLQAEHARQTAELESRREGIAVLSGAVRDVVEAIRQLEKEFPNSPDLPQLREDYEQLKIAEKTAKDKWQEAYATLGEFAQEIKQAGRVWTAACAIAKARGLSGLSQAEWEAKLKTETSFGAIRAKLNTNMAALSVDQMKADADTILKGKIGERRMKLNTPPAPQVQQGQ